MVYERTLEEVDNFVLDLDGTVWEWNRLKKGVKKTLQTLEKNDKNIYFLTNNAILRREQYAEKLRNLDVNANTEDVISASYIASQVFEEEGITSAYVIGEEGLRAELRKNGIKHKEDADDVLVSVDRNFSYWKMAEAADLVRNGATLWSTSLDAYWWAGDRDLPGTQALADSVRQSAGAKEGTINILGKPSDHAQKIVRDEWGLRPDNTVLIGDNVQSDVVFANKMGFMSGLVMGGSTGKADLEQVEKLEKPNIVFREFKRIIMKL